MCCGVRTLTVSLELDYWQYFESVILTYVCCMVWTLLFYTNLKLLFREMFNVKCYYSVRDDVSMHVSSIAPHKKRQPMQKQNNALTIIINHFEHNYFKGYICKFRLLVTMLWLLVFSVPHPEFCGKSETRSIWTKWIFSLEESIYNKHDKHVRFWQLYRMKSNAPTSLNKIGPTIGSIATNL